MKNTKFIKSLLIGTSLVLIVTAVPTAMAGDGDPNYNGYANHNTKKHYNGCTEYRLSSYGGQAGVRTVNNPNDFRQANNGSVVGQICAKGRVTVELSKRHPDTHVSLVLYGQEYVFGQGDRGDKLLNNWFRRYLTVDLPHGSGQQGNSQGGGYSYQPQYKPDNHGYNQGYKNVPQSASRYEGHGYSQGHEPEPYFQDHGYNNSGHNNGYNNGYHHNKRKFHTASRKHKRAHKFGRPHQHYGQYFAFQ